MRIESEGGQEEEEEEEEEGGVKTQVTHVYLCVPHLAVECGQTHRERERDWEEITMSKMSPLLLLLLLMVSGMTRSHPDGPPPDCALQAPDHAGAVEQA